MGMLKLKRIPDEEIWYSKPKRARTIEKKAGWSCHACGKARDHILAMDSSQGEYGYVRVCKSCIDKAFFLLAN